jgi:hypothetical protein
LPNESLSASAAVRATRKENTNKRHKIIIVRSDYLHVLPSESLSASAAVRTTRKENTNKRHKIIIVRSHYLHVLPNESLSASATVSLPVNAACIAANNRFSSMKGSNNTACHMKRFPFKS